MASFIIEGGHRLTGSITPQGAKNEALQVICATLLTSEPVRIKNIPNILDVNNLIQLLRDIDVEVTQNGAGDYTFRAADVNLEYLSSPEFLQRCSRRAATRLAAGVSTRISSDSINSGRNSLTMRLLGAIPFPPTS